MSSGKSLLTVFVALALVGTACAQPAPVVAQPAVPVFQVNPMLVPQAGNGAGQPPAFAGIQGQPGVGLARLSSVTTPFPVVGPAQSYVPRDPMPGGGYPSYPYPPYPYYPSIDFGPGSALRGLGDLTRSYGQYIQDYRRGQLLNQEVERSKIETRLRLYQEWRYYESMRPKAEDLRVATLERELTRARQQPPVSDILAAKSLNDLLAFARGVQAKGQRGPAVPLDQELMKRINVATEFGGNIALIKTGKIDWPLVLKNQAFNEPREKFDLTLENAVHRARSNGKVDDALMRELQEAYRKLDDLVDSSNLSGTPYLEARRTVNSLSAALRALADPNVSHYLAGAGGEAPRYSAKGKTVGDLIDHMIREGLKFAPAMPGDEPAYRMLYTALAAYDSALQYASNR